MTAKIPVAGQSVKAKASAPGAVLTESPATSFLVLIMDPPFIVNLLLGDRPSAGKTALWARPQALPPFSETRCPLSVLDVGAF